MTPHKNYVLDPRPLVPTPMLTQSAFNNDVGYLLNKSGLLEFNVFTQSLSMVTANYFSMILYCPPGNPESVIIHISVSSLYIF